MVQVSILLSHRLSSFRGDLQERVSHPPIISPMTERDRVNRRAIDQRCAALIAQGLCPAYQQFLTNDSFPGQQEQTYYQDALITCHLESYLRGVGHTIIVARTHYADSAEMPGDLGCDIMRMPTVLVHARKTMVEAEKVYMVTICSDALSGSVPN